MKRLSLMLSVITISTCVAQEKQPLKWQASYGFKGVYVKQMNNKFAFQNHSLSYGIYRDINRRWYWNADVQLSYMNYNNTAFPIPTSDTSFSMNEFRFSGLGLGLNYRIGYKFIEREKFSASFFLGINTSSLLYGESYLKNDLTGASNKSIYSFNRGTINFLGGIQAEYKLNDRSSLFMTYEFTNNLRFNSFTNNSGILQFGYRKAFKN